MACGMRLVDAAANSLPASSNVLYVYIIIHVIYIIHLIKS